MSEVDLLQRLPEALQDHLHAAALTLRLQPGELLLRRGEQGGDLYRLVAGTLEVIDGRTEPPVVLEVVGEGAMLGEMAFLDGSVRSADVRAAEACTCQLWRREELQHLLQAEPALGHAFYRALADLVNARSRNVREVAAHHRRAATAPGSSFATAEAVLTHGLRRKLLDAEPLLHADTAAGRRHVRQALEAFYDGWRELAARVGLEERATVLSRIADDLRPFLVQSALGRQCLTPASGATDDPAVLSHVASGEARGDGELGVELDHWLLQLPTTAARRERAAVAVAAARAAAPRRALVVNGGRSGLADRLVRELPDTEFERLDEGALTAWALGERETPATGGGDLIVLDGVLDSLPDRLAAPLLGSAATWSGGRILATGLAPSPDTDLFTHLLAWPQIRRADTALLRLARHAGVCDARLIRCGVGVCLHTGGSPRPAFANDAPPPPIELPS